MADNSTKKEFSPYVKIESKRHSIASISSDSSIDDVPINAPLVKQRSTSGDITIVPKRVTLKDSVEDLESAYLENSQLTNLTEELSYVISLEAFSFLRIFVIFAFSWFLNIFAFSWFLNFSHFHGIFSFSRFLCFLHFFLCVIFEFLHFLFFMFCQDVLIFCSLIK